MAWHHDRFDLRRMHCYTAGNRKGGARGSEESQVIVGVSRTKVGV